MTTDLKKIEFLKKDKQIVVKNFCSTSNFVKIEKQKKDNFIDTRNEICLSKLDIGLDYIYKDCIVDPNRFVNETENSNNVLMSAFFECKKISGKGVSVETKFLNLFNSKFLKKTDKVILLSPGVLENKKTYQKLKRFENTNYFEMYQFIDNDLKPIIFNDIDNCGFIFPYIPKNISNMRSVLGFFRNGKLVTNLKSGEPYEVRYQNIIVTESDKDCIKIEPDCFLPINMSILNPSKITDNTFKSKSTLVSSSDFLDSLNSYNEPLVVKLYLREYYTLSNESIVQNVCSLNNEVDMRCVKGMYNFLVTFGISTKNFQKYYVTLSSCVKSNSQNFNGISIIWLIMGVIFGGILVFIIFSLIKSIRMNKN